ncbi:MAG: zinc-binding dehydrogenase [Sedimentisphaerales bacterium]
MKALVKYGNKVNELEIRDVPVPKISCDDVLLEVRAAGICGWDIEMWRHKMACSFNVPVIQGHEFCGVIKEVGKNVKDFKTGQRVVSETAAQICGKCPQCRTGNYHLCPDRKGFGYGVDGAFAEYVKVPARCLHRIPENISFEDAALTEPACVAYQALVVLSKIRAGTAVLIIGPGPIGLFSVQVAAACGAYPIMVAGTDKDTKRLETARKLGSDFIIDVTSEDAVEFIKGKTNAQGVPLVVDAAGNENTLRLAIETVAPQGQITKIGWGPRPINFSLDALLSKAARLQGTFSHNWPTWEAVLAMMSRGLIRMEPMISHRITLDKWEETFEIVEKCQATKAVIVFD